eukprot:763654-Hanusia_phi.AAC.2
MAGKCETCGKQSDAAMCEACMQRKLPLHLSSSLVMFTCPECGSENEVVERVKLICEICGYGTEVNEAADAIVHVAQDELLSIGASDSGAIGSFFCSSCSSFNENVLISSQGTICQSCGSLEPNPYSTVMTTRKPHQSLSSLDNIPEESEVERVEGKDSQTKEVEAHDRVVLMSPIPHSQNLGYGEGSQKIQPKYDTQQGISALNDDDKKQVLTSTSADLLRENSELNRNITLLQQKLLSSDGKMHILEQNIQTLNSMVLTFQQEKTSYKAFMETLSELLQIRQELHHSETDTATNKQQKIITKITSIMEIQNPIQTKQQTDEIKDERAAKAERDLEAERKAGAEAYE